MADLDPLKEAEERAALLKSSMTEDYQSLVGAAAEWACQSWEDLIQEVLQQQPEKVLGLGRDRIRALKAAVDDLIEEADDHARAALRGPWVVHEWSTGAASEALSHEELRSLGDRVGDPTETDWADDVKAAFRSLYAAAVPVLREAGLDEPPIPPPAQIFERAPLDPEATESLTCYAGGARVFGEALLALKVAQAAKRRTEAQALWDEA